MIRLVVSSGHVLGSGLVVWGDQMSGDQVMLCGLMEVGGVISSCCVV